MGLKSTWNDLGTGGKALLGLAVLGVFVVVAIVLMVVIAAVIGSFVLSADSTGGTGDGTAPPQVQFSSSVDGSTMTITHEGGDSIETDELTLLIGDRATEWADSGTVSAGDSTTVEVESGQTVQIVWESPDGASTALFRETA
ncbi:MAG: type IV pilin [Halococcoides sp.]